MERVTPRTLSGFMELLPNDQLKFNKIMDAIRYTYEKFGFLPLDTPIIESSEVLLAKAGGETEKQIYQIKRGDSDLTLRFDLTVPLAKYVAMHYSELSFPFRRYQIGKVYRGERAQKGRFREFYQCDIDVIGDNELSIVNDAEIPYIIYTIFNKIGLNNFVVKINNRKLLSGYFDYLGLKEQSSEIMRIVDKIKKIGEDNVRLTLKDFNIEDNKIDSIMNFISIEGNNFDILNKLKVLKIENDIFKQGLDELEKVVKYSISFGMDRNAIEIDLTISRGLDYYTGTVYETFLREHTEIGSICSGGRYDNLAEYYTDKKLPGVGISIGLTRLFDQLMDLDVIKSDEVSLTDVLIIPMTDNYDYMINVYNKINNTDKKALIFYEKRSIKSIINYATNLNIKKVIFIGEDEIKEGKVTLKDLNTRLQTTDTIENIIKEL